jgi:2-alkyl-3-oxoalkanoate reductase
MRILVTGATGFIGRELVRAAARAGHEVVALTRRDAPELREHGAETIVGDVVDVTAADLPERISDVVHLATGTEGAGETVVEVAVRGTRRLLAAARAHRVRRFVHVSSQSVYPGPLRRDAAVPGGRALEAHPERRGAYARAKTLAERQLHELARDGGLGDLELVILRPGLVFGRDMASVLAGTAMQLPLGLTVGLGRPSQGVPFLGLDDLVRALLALLARDPEHGAVQIFDVLSGEPPTKRRLLEVYRELSGQDGRELWIPEPAALLAGRLADGVLFRGSPRSLPYNVRRAYRFEPRGLPYAALWTETGEEPHAELRASVASALTIDRVQGGGRADGRDELVRRAEALLGVARGSHAAGGRPVGLVVVGAGRIVSEMHVPALRRLTDYAVRAVVDPNLELAETVARGFPDARALASLAELDGDLLRDATAVLATPGSTHHSLARELLERGVPLLVEKPVALTGDDFGELRTLAERSDLPVTVFHNYRLRPASLALWSFLRLHDVGRLVKAELVFHSRRLSQEAQRWLHEEKRNRSLVMELALHFLDLAFVAGGPLESLDHFSVVDRETARSTVSLTGTARLERCDELRFDLDLSGTAPRTRLTLELERAACVLDFFPDGFRVLPRRSNPVDDLAADLGRLAGALGQRLRPQMNGVPKRALPHLSIYREHLRRLRGEAGESPFSLAGVADTMSSLERLCEVAYPAPRPAAEPARLPRAVPGALP